MSVEILRIYLVDGNIYNVWSIDLLDCNIYMVRRGDLSGGACRTVVTRRRGAAARLSTGPMCAVALWSPEQANIRQPWHFLARNCVPRAPFWYRTAKLSPAPPRIISQSAIHQWGWFNFFSDQKLDYLANYFGNFTGRANFECTRTKNTQKYLWKYYTVTKIIFKAKNWFFLKFLKKND